MKPYVAIHPFFLILFSLLMIGVKPQFNEYLKTQDLVCGSLKYVFCKSFRPIYLWTCLTASIKNSTEVTNLGKSLLQHVDEILWVY